MVGPLGMPRETVAKLNAELAKVLNTAEMKERFAKQGTEVRTGTPESLGQWMGDRAGEVGQGGEGVRSKV